MVAVSLLFAGCGTAPDRVALNSLSTIDAAANVAYRAWVQDWARREVSAQHATNAVEAAKLDAELGRVDKALKEYQSAHKQATKLAALAVQTGAITNLPAILDGAKYTLTNLLNQVQAP